MEKDIVVLDLGLSLDREVSNYGGIDMVDVHINYCTVNNCSKPSGD